MNIYKKILIFIVLLSSKHSIADTYSIEDLMQEAITNNPKVLSQHHLIEEATQQFSASQWRMYPTPYISAELDKNNENELIIGLSQPLLVDGEEFANLNLSLFSLNEAKAQKKLMNKDIKLNIIDTYSNIIKYYYELNNIKKYIYHLSELEKMMIRRVQSYYSAEIDLHLLKSRIYLAQSRLKNIDSKLAENIVIMSELTTLQLNVKIIKKEINGNFWDPTSIDKKYLVETIIDKSPEILIADAKISQAKSELKLINSKFWPKASLNIEKYQKSSDYKEGSSRVFISLSYALNGGLSDFSLKSAAHHKISAAISNKMDMKNILRRQVSLFLNEYVHASDLSLKLKNNSLNHKNILAAYKRMFVTGRKTWLELLNEIREETEIEIQLIDAKVKKINSSFSLAILFETNLN